MLIVFKAINICWRKCFCHKGTSHLKSLLFSQTIKTWAAHLWTKQGHTIQYSWNMHRWQWSERSKHIRSNWAFDSKTFTQIHESMQHNND